MSLSRQQVIARIFQQLSDLDNTQLEQIYNLLFENEHIVHVSDEGFEQQDMVD